MSRRRRALALAVTVALVSSVVATPSISTQFGDGSSSPAQRATIPESVDTDGLEPGAPLDGADATNFTAVHESGVTGQGVRVGVVGRRFGGDAGPLSGHVAADRHFAGDRPVRFADGSHDTAVAEVVAETAPDARLYLASVGARPTPEEYARAIGWLLAQGVDVIVDSASYFPRTSEGMTRINDVATQATRDGVVFVTSAGNYANRHWAGDADRRGWVTFENGVQGNPLGQGTLSGKVLLRLYWSGDADYDLYLYRHSPGPGSDPVVAKSTDRQAGKGSHAEAIDVRVPPGKYYVAIYAEDPAENASRVDLFAGRHRLRYTVADGSMVAPATAENVIAVGAVSPETGETRPYSSRSSTLDLAAPDGRETRGGRLFGTSAAAPLVAGTAALMESRPGELSPAEAERILETTAVRSAGRLTVDPVAAVRAVNDPPASMPARVPEPVSPLQFLTQAAASDPEGRAGADAPDRESSTAGTHPVSSRTARPTA